MKSQVDPRVFIGVIVVVVVIVGFLIARKFSSSPANSPAISAAQAGLGKPVYPHIPNMGGTANPGGATR